MALEEKYLFTNDSLDADQTMMAHTTDHQHQFLYREPHTGNLVVAK